MKTCPICNAELTSSRATYCGKSCKKKAERRNARDRVNSTKDESELVECLLCNHKYGTLFTHLKNVHNITCDQYQTQFPNSKITSKKYANDVSKRVSGELNPGYDHGGTLSPWSDRSLYHTTEQINEAKHKAIATLKNKNNQL